MKLCSRRREILGPVTTPDSRTHTIDDVEGARSRLTFFKVMAFMAGGAFLGYFPFTLLIYTGLMTILVAYYGKDQS